MKTKAHTLQERYDIQESLVKELVEEVRSLEDIIEDMKSDDILYTGIINGVEYDDIDIVISKYIVVAVSGNDHAVIDIRQGNTSMLFENEEHSAIVSLWNEVEERSTLFSEEVVLGFPSDKEAKQFYRKITALLSKYYGRE